MNKAEIWARNSPHLASEGFPGVDNDYVTWTKTESCFCAFNISKNVLDEKKTEISISRFIKGQDFKLAFHFSIAWNDDNRLGQMIKKFESIQL